MLKAIIFDCFGVLYPSGSNEFYDNHKESFKDGTKVIDEANLKIDLGDINRKQYFAMLESATNIPAAQIEKEYTKDEFVPDKNLVALIKQLKMRYKIGLLSNTGKEEISMIYRHGVAKVFDVLTMPYQVNAIKPDPEIFKASLLRLGVEPQEALFIDDNQSYVRAAEALGIQGLHYPQFGTIPESLTRLL